MIYARTLRSSRPRARIVAVKLPKIPEGYIVVDWRDVPGTNRVHMIEDDWPFFAEDRVNYSGEPILLVVGPEKTEVGRLLSAVEIEYENLNPVFDIDDSVAGRDTPVYGDDNTMAAYRVERGSPAVEFEGAARIFEDEYRTGLQEHAYLEPQGIVALYDEGRITVYGSMQCPFYVKSALEMGFGWDPDRIRVVQTVTGGGFGGKEEYPSILAGHAAFAAYKSGRPVQLILDRTEDICYTTKRHPSKIRYRTAVDEEGRITAMDVHVQLDGGAYSGLSSVVLQRAMFMAAGVYNVPNIRITGEVVATNNVPTGAFRGFGAPQALFAVEMHLQTIAEHLGEDPLDYKLRHALRRGDRTVTGGTMHHDVKLPEMVDRILEMSQYRQKRKRAPRKTRDGHRGIGLSMFFHGCAFTGSGERDKIRAVVKLQRDTEGRVRILISNVEMGQGPQTALRKIVAKTLGVPADQLIYDNPDTDQVPNSGPTAASRTVIIVGALLEKAAEDLKAQWDEPGEIHVSRHYEQPAYMCWDQERLRGDAYLTYSWGVNVVEVEVDPVSFEIGVTGIWGVYDVGTPIDEQLVKGQIEGGMVQGLGYATVEVMQLHRGEPLQANMTDYTIPTSMEFPPIETDLVESFYEQGPQGAKCVGELPFLGVAPALASAVQHALQTPINHLPVTPEYLVEVSEP
jgi:CO/xanthine dehydrogenase Mo-binding subunit